MRAVLCYNKTMIFGSPGSGKSTYAKKLSKKLQIPVYYLDQYFFSSNWQEIDENVFLSMQQNIVDQEKWIIDGNCIHSLEMRYQKSDLVLYFSYPKLICFYRIFKRRFLNNNLVGRNKDCTEQITWKFIKYIWNFDKIVKHKINDLKITYPKIKFCKVSSDLELKNLYSELTLNLL